jgi:hypothetical protein
MKLQDLITPLGVYSLQDIVSKREKKPFFQEISSFSFSKKTDYLNACAFYLLEEVLKHISYKIPSPLSENDHHDIFLDLILSTAEVLSPYKKILKKIMMRDIFKDPLTLSPLLLKTSHTYWEKLLRAIHYPHPQKGALILLLCSTYTLSSWFEGHEQHREEFDDHYMQKVDEVLKTTMTWKKSISDFFAI